MDKDITLPELHSIILKSKINRSPGPDGFSNEILKVSRPAGWRGDSVVTLKHVLRDKGRFLTSTSIKELKFRFIKVVVEQVQLSHNAP